MTEVYTPEVMRARFHENMRALKAIQAQVAPLRADYDALQAQIDALRDAQRVIGEKIKAIERPRASELTNEAALLARALNGKTGADWLEA